MSEPMNQGGQHIIGQDCCKQPEENPKYTLESLCKKHNNICADLNVLLGMLPSAMSYEQQCALSRIIKNLNL
jgi:hypothetical protein